MKTVPISPQRKGLAGRCEGWFTVTQAPEFYLSKWSGFLHRVKHAETVVDLHTGLPIRVCVTHWCGGTGSVNRVSTRAGEGEWRQESESPSHSKFTVCQNCIAKYNKQLHES